MTPDIPILNEHDSWVPVGNAGERIRVVGRVVNWQTEPLGDGEAKPLTRVLVDVEQVEPREVTDAMREAAFEVLKRYRAGLWHINGAIVTEALEAAEKARCE